MDGGMYVAIFYHIYITNHRQLDKLIHHYIYLIDLIAIHFGVALYSFVADRRYYP